MVNYKDPSPATSFGSDLPARELLFGEIDSTGTPSLRTNTSSCTLTLSSSPGFTKFWLVDLARDNFLSFVERHDLESLRLVCHDFSNRAAPYLFRNVHTSFRAGTFTKPARRAALERIGRYVQSFTLDIPHTSETFLPPLLDPQTGEERSFTYTPQLHASPTSPDGTKPLKYGSWEVTDLLVKQYPPLFHAATNVPSFVRAFSALPKLSHLVVRCPGRDGLYHFRRSVVDYALISLRMAIEHAPLDCLDTLSFLPMHPAGLFYMQPLLGFGATPKSAKRWSQIQRIAIHIEGLDSDSVRNSDYLKTLHTYLRTFSLSLTELRFRWTAIKGPCPLSLSSEPCVSPTNPYDKPPGCHSNLRPLYFRRLRCMNLENAIMDASQISSFLSHHRKTLTEINFDDVKLRSGNWEEALSPFSSIVHDDRRTRTAEDVMEVPIVLSQEHSKEDTVDFAPPDEKSRRLSTGLGRWLSRARSGRATCKAQEQSSGGRGHMRKLFRSSVLTWVGAS